MKLPFIATLSAVTVLALLTGCSGSAPAPAATDSSDNALTASESQLVGTFVNDGSSEDHLPFYSITLNADQTYSWRGGCRPAKPGGAQCFAITGQTGTWALDKSGPQLGAPLGARELVLTPSNGDPTAYFFSFTKGTLSLGETLVGDRSVFQARDSDPSGNSDDDGCGPITTITCEAGYEPSTDSCAQPADGAPRGRCVQTTPSSDDGCGPITTITCENGFIPSTDGCTQPTAPNAASIPRGHCVPQ